MGNNTIAIVNKFGEKTDVSETKLDAIRSIITNYVEQLFGRKFSITERYTDEEIKLLMLCIPSAARIKNMKTVDGAHWCFSAASIADEELYLLY